MNHGAFARAAAALGSALLVAAAPAPAPRPAPAPLAITAEPAVVAAALQLAGYKAEITKDESGDPMIKSGAGGHNLLIFFAGCKDHSHCTDLQLYAGFTTGKPFPIERINEWNSTHRYGRGYVDKVHDPVVEFDIDLDAGGEPYPLFRDQLETWSRMIAAFDAFVFEQAPAPAATPGPPPVG